MPYALQPPISNSSRICTPARDFKHQYFHNGAKYKQIPDNGQYQHPSSWEIESPSLDHLLLLGISQPNYDLWSRFWVLGMVATTPGTVRNSSSVLCSCSGCSACMRRGWGQNQVSCQILIDPGWSPGHTAANFNTRIINVCHSFRRTCDQLNKVATKVCRTFVRWSRVLCRAGHEPSRSLKMYNHKEGLY